MSINAVWGPPHSGKTTLAIDLAYALSQKGQSVCLISPELYSELSARIKINVVRYKAQAHIHVWGRRASFLSLPRTREVARDFSEVSYEANDERSDSCAAPLYVTFICADRFPPSVACGRQLPRLREPRRRTS